MNEMILIEEIFFQQFNALADVEIIFRNGCAGLIRWYRRCFLLSKNRTGREEIRERRERKISALFVLLPREWFLLIFFPSTKIVSYNTMGGNLSVEAATMALACSMASSVPGHKKTSQELLSHNDFLNTLAASSASSSSSLGPPFFILPACFCSIPVKWSGLNGGRDRLIDRHPMWQHWNSIAHWGSIVDPLLSFTEITWRTGRRGFFLQLNATRSLGKCFFFIRQKFVS